jgi:methionyl-tRNA formyltransferase
MRVVFAGTPAAALPSLDALLRSRHDVLGVVTRPDSTAGRGRKLSPSPVAQQALEAGLVVLRPPSPKDPDFMRHLRDLAPDCCAAVAYGALLPEDALEIPCHGWVNLHFSLLPAWRGAAPVQRALIAGDEFTGATTFRIVPTLDAGPVFAFFTERIRVEDTAGTLARRLAEHGAGLLVSTLDGIEDGSLQARPQDDRDASYAPKLTVEEARIRWHLPALAVDRLIRGCTPAPGAWTTVGDVRVKIGPTTPRPDVTDLAPGQLRVFKSEVVVGTGTHAVALTTVHPQGKQAMDAADWARGLRTRSWSVLGAPSP